MARHYFERGNAIFKCSVCGRNARNTTDQFKRDVCGLCNEIGEIENGISDNNLQGAELQEAELRIYTLQKEVIKRGGVGPMPEVK